MHDVLNLTRRALMGAGGVLLITAVMPRAFGQAAKRPIGVIGSGNIGGTIGGLWIKAGHPVMFSSRKPDELKDMVARLGPLARAGTVAQTIGFADTLLIAVPYDALPGIGRDNQAALKDKVVLDACNALPPRDSDAMVQEVMKNGIGVTSQKYLPGTRLVRAFNSINYKVFASEAGRPDPRLPVPIAGDDAEAVQVAASLVRDAGFEPVVAGKLADAPKFNRGGPAVGQTANAAELRKKLGLTP